MFVDDDAVVGGKPRFFGDLDVRHDADRDDHHVGGDAFAVGGLDRDRAAVLADHRRRARAEAELRAALLVPCGEVPRHAGRDDAAHDALGHLQHGDGLALRGGDRGEFQSDETGADDDDGPRLRQPRLERIGLRQRADIENALELRARQRQQPVARAEREHEMVIGERLAGSERDLLAGRIDRRDTRLRHQLDAVVAIEGVRPQPQRLQGHLALQIGFRQRRPLIRQPGLVADQDDPAVETVVAQRGGGLHAAMPRTRDHHRLRHPDTRSDHAVVVIDSPGRID